MAGDSNMAALLLWVVYWGSPVADRLLGIVAFHVVAVRCRGGRFGFRFRGLPGGAQASGAEMAAIFHVVILGQRRNHGRASGNLANAVQDDFGTTVVEFNGTVYFDGATF